MNIQKELEKECKERVSLLNVKEEDFSSLSLLVLQDESLGDFASNAGFLLSKILKKSPLECADLFIEIKEKPEYISSFSIAGAGFINISLKRDVFQKNIQEILSKKEKWGKNDTYKGKKILVEHTQPNPFKPFHIGHLMTNSLGESIARLFEFSGAEVRRANYQGDVGLHVAKCLWGLEKRKGDPSSLSDLAEGYVYGNKMYEGEDEEVKKEIQDFNKKIYEMDESIKDAYEKGKRVSLLHFEKIYSMLGTHFDYYFFESETEKRGRMMVKEGFAKNIFSEGEGGALIYIPKGEGKELHTRVFLTQKGLPTYEAKELGLAEVKNEKWDFDYSFTTSAVEQKGILSVAYDALFLLRPSLREKMSFIFHGMMMLKEGKMGSRKGNVITGEALLKEMISLAEEKVKERDMNEEEKKESALCIAVASIKYSILKQKSGKNIVFDKNEALSFEGASGPYLQYSLARAYHVLENAEKEKVKEDPYSAPSEAFTLEKKLLHFENVIERAQKEKEPHYIATYLSDLAREWNSLYAREKILDGTLSSPYKCALVHAFLYTMENGLYLLGIKAVKKM
jgi:arginyl-tRNA synthetase